jgi:hypothetical protein
MHIPMDVLDGMLNLLPELISIQTWLAFLKNDLLNRNVSVFLLFLDLQRCVSITFSIGLSQIRAFHSRRISINLSSILLKVLLGIDIVEPMILYRYSITVYYSSIYFIRYSGTISTVLGLSRVPSPCTGTSTGIAEPVNINIVNTFTIYM